MSERSTSVHDAAVSFIPGGLGIARTVSVDVRGKPYSISVYQNPGQWS
jgi:hypothetical protein